MIENGYDVMMNTLTYFVLSKTRMKINFPFQNNFDADFLLIFIVFGDQQQAVLKINN